MRRKWTEKQVNKVIGARVRYERQDREWTTTKLAEKVGVSQAQISRLENGLQGFRSIILYRLAWAFSMAVGDMLDEL